MIFAIILFVITYVAMLVFGKYRPYIALGSGLIFIISGMLPLGNILGEIDFNVLLMIGGTMGLVELFVISKMPARLADILMKKMPNVQWAAVCLSLFAGVISAFVDNVATVLMVAPVALAICEKLKTNPVPVLIAIAVSSNLQGAATLVGDTTAIMLGSALDMSFLDFFWYQGKPSMFFAVELGAVLSALIVLFIFRKEKEKLPPIEEVTKVEDIVPTVLLLSAVGLLILASFAPASWNLPAETNGIICCALLVVGLVYTAIRTKNTKQDDQPIENKTPVNAEHVVDENAVEENVTAETSIKENPTPKKKRACSPKLQAVLAPLKAIDFQTLGLLLGLFLIIGGIKNEGVIDALANLLAQLGGDKIFLLYTIIVWGSVLISAFIDNIPYVATMIPVIGALATQMATAMGVDATLIATPLYFGLLSGATLGGNITPIGASANITAIGILRKNGYEVKNKDFFKIGIPFTLAAIIPAYIYVWLVFGV